jgi:hypothetical protein
MTPEELEDLETAYRSMPIPKYSTGRTVGGVVPNPFIPKFEWFMGNRTQFKHLEYHISFLDRAEKYLIDRSEFVSWGLENEAPHDDATETGLTMDINPKEIWIELFDFKMGQSGPIGEVDGRFELYGAGYSYDEELIFVCSVDNKRKVIQFSQYDFDKLQSMNEDFEAMEFKLNAAWVLGSMCRYLKGKYVKAELKETAPLKVPRLRSKNKFKRKPVPYKTAFLKKPDCSDANTPRATYDQRSAVEYSHRWQVRGHWRRVRGCGHDENGNRIIGKTWVRECVRGPSDKPIVKKTTIARDKLPKGYEEVRA